MNSDLERQFSRYLANLMSEDEKKSFEQELASNKELNEEFEEYQIGMIAGKRIQYLELKDRVSGILEDEDSKQGGATVIKFNSKRLYYSMPAAALALILVSLVYVPISKKNGEAIYTQHNTESSYSMLRGDSDNNIDQAIIQYQSENFDSVLLLIDQMPEKEQNQAFVHRLRGNTLVARNELNSAMFAFKNSITETESADHLEAYWNIGRLYSKNEKYDSSIIYLNKVVQSKYNSTYKKSAKKLLSEVKWQQFIQKWFGWLVN